MALLAGVLGAVEVALGLGGAFTGDLRPVGHAGRRLRRDLVEGGAELGTVTAAGGGGHHGLHPSLECVLSLGAAVEIFERHHHRRVAHRAIRCRLRMGDAHDRQQHTACHARPNRVRPHASTLARGQVPSLTAPAGATTFGTSRAGPAKQAPTSPTPGDRSTFPGHQRFPALLSPRFRRLYFGKGFRSRAASEVADERADHAASELGRLVEQGLELLARDPEEARSRPRATMLAARGAPSRSASSPERGASARSRGALVVLLLDREAAGSRRRTARRPGRLRGRRRRPRRPRRAGRSRRRGRAPRRRGLRRATSRAARGPSRGRPSIGSFSRKLSRFLSNFSHFASQPS